MQGGWWRYSRSALATFVKTLLSVSSEQHELHSAARSEPSVYPASVEKRTGGGAPVQQREHHAGHENNSSEGHQMRPAERGREPAERVRENRIWFDLKEASCTRSLGTVDARGGE